MDLAEAFLQAIGAGLNLLLAANDPRKEAVKLSKEWRELKDGYYSEKNKADPDMAVLDDYRNRIRLLGCSFTAIASAPGKQDVSVSP